MSVLSQPTALDVSEAEVRLDSMLQELADSEELVRALPRATLLDAARRFCAVLALTSCEEEPLWRPPQQLSDREPPADQQDGARSEAGSPEVPSLGEGEGAARSPAEDTQPDGRFFEQLWPGARVSDVCLGKL